MFVAVLVRVGDQLQATYRPMIGLVVVDLMPHRGREILIGSTNSKVDPALVQIFGEIVIHQFRFLVVHVNTQQRILSPPSDTHIYENQWS